MGTFGLKFWTCIFPCWHRYKTRALLSSLVFLRINCTATTSNRCTQGKNQRKSLIQDCVASEASSVYILSRQNAKNGQFGEFLKTWNLRSNIVTRQVNFDRTGEKCQNCKIKMRHFRWFLNIVIAIWRIFQTYFLRMRPPLY